MKAKTIGNQALSGWRTKVGKPVAKQLSQRTRLKADQVEAAIGALFFLSSVWYVFQTIRGAIKKG